MNIKDFKRDQEVYVLDMHIGRNVDPTIRKDTVTGVGRKYVTVEGGRKYESYGDSYSLIENCYYGDKTYLCPSVGCAQAYIERNMLRIWLYEAAQHGNEYTLEQLRKVKEILEV